MCRKPALAATTAIILAAASLASPAAALGFGRGAKVDKPAAAASVVPTARPAAPPKVTPQERAMADRLDPLARSAFWANVLNGDPSDTEAGVKLAGALRLLGRADESTMAAQRVLVIQPDNVEALLEVGRGYIGQQQGFYAIEPVRRAQALTPHDWRAPALLAVALEQAERDDEALAAHRQALALAPNNPTVLSNLGMYYAGHGDAPQAERLLRQAAADPAASVQVRQNLALVLGLQGRIAEAEQIARRDLPPAVVANNLAYLRAATGETPARNWDSMRDPSQN
jgi:Flp pilus assembly protein TadD